MEKPLISVIVPVYNLEKYLPRTLDSILAQTYENLELVLVDDGSQDGSRAIMADYARRDSRVRTIYKDNEGVTRTRMRGVQEARGAWIGFVDGDDYIEPEMYQRLMANALESGAEISHCGYQMILPSGHVDYYHNSGVKLVHDHTEGLRELVSCRLVEPGLWNKLFRREVLERFFQSGEMNTDIRINEDLLMNYYLFKAADKSVFEDFCPYHYIVRRGSAANGRLNRHMLVDPVRVRHLLFEDTADQPELHAMVAGQLIREMVVLATMSDREDPELIRPIRAQVRRSLREMLGDVLTQRTFGSKSKITALWAAVWPASYRWVHQVYARATGIDHKYEK